MPKLIPLMNHVVVDRDLSDEDEELVSSVLSTNTQSEHADVLQYGRVTAVAEKAMIAGTVIPMESFNISVGDLIAYQKLASHNVKLGSENHRLIPVEYIHGKVA